MSTAPARSQPHPAQTTRKRRASSAFTECPDDATRKRMRDADTEPELDVHAPDSTAVAAAGLVDDVAQELQCACCSELVYRPVLVIPCQHFFCGRCVRRTRVCALLTMSPSSLGYAAAVCSGFG